MATLIVTYDLDEEVMQEAELDEGEAHDEVFDTVDNALGEVLHLDNYTVVKGA